MNTPANDAPRLQCATNEPFVLSLDTIGPEDAALVGHKAWRLAMLRQAGVTVPAGFVVTRAAWQAAQDCVAQALPSAVRVAIASAYSELGPAIPVAVRSSALDADLEPSFADQCAASLNVVGVQAVVEGIQACWAVWNNAHLVDYRHQRGLDVAPAGGMAVLVQVLIDADAAGVLSTLNPLTGFEEQMVVEAIWGLGDILGTGHVTPDRYLLDREQRCLLSCDVGTKQLQSRPAKQGTEQRPTTSAQQATYVLDLPHMLELVALGERIQAYFGAPQHIEWAQRDGAFMILQTCPLAACHYSDERGQWTSANFREIMPGIVTPMIFSLDLVHGFTRSFAAFARSVGLSDDDTIIQARLLFGRVYWRVDRFKALMRGFPGFRERAFDATVGVTPTYQGDGYVTPITLRTLARGLPIQLRLWWYYLTYAPAARAYKQRYLTTYASLRHHDLRRCDEAALAALVRRALELHGQTCHITLMCAFIAQQTQQELQPILDAVNEHLPSHAQLSAGTLLSGLGDICTARPLTTLWEVVHIAHRLPEVADLLQHHPPEDIQGALLRAPAGRDFWNSVLAGYIERFHYLASPGEDLTMQRWDEDPQIPLRLLQRFMAQEHPVDPIAHDRLQRQKCAQEERRIWALVARHPLQVVRLLLQLAIARRYVRLRESIREIVSMSHYLVRRTLLAQGQRWAGTVLAQVDDIFWLDRDEVFQALDGSLDASEAQTRVHRRRLTAQSYRNFEPPAVIGGLPASQHKPSNRHILHGVACSPGVACGPARIITAPTQVDRLAAGDILVAPYTNPGWTPLFGVAAALIIEEGGLLSHGAVVAREYGLPAVLRVSGATQRIGDGQWVCVDGTSGTVELLDQQPIP